MLLSILHLGFILIFLFFVFTVIYLLVFSVAGRVIYRERYLGARLLPGYRKIAVLVPAYKEDGIIMSTATNLQHLDYPENFYDIYIIADSFQPDTILELRALERVNVLEVSFDKSTKTKSLNEAFRRIEKEYDIALICDADNMLGEDFLNRVNQAFLQGARAVQGQRVAKNLDTPFAILDACSEAINNTIFRKGANGLGISSSVIGSGMAFEYVTIKGILSSIQAVGGFDKILQLRVVESGDIIHFLASAVVFDEKVDSPEAFERQRRRWVSSQFIYLKQFVGPAFKQLFRGNWSYFNLALVSNLILPRAFLLALLPLVAVLGFFMGVPWGVAGILLWLLYLASLLIALPSVMMNKDLTHALAKLPGAVLMMMSTLLHIKKANKTFIHTVHTKTEISNTLFNDKSKG